MNKYNEKEFCKQYKIDSIKFLDKKNYNDVLMKFNKNSYVRH